MENLVELVGKHKVAAASVAGGVILFALFARRSSSKGSALTPQQYLVPDQLVASPSGATLTVTGPGNTTGITDPAGGVTGSILSDIPQQRDNPASKSRPGAPLAIAPNLEPPPNRYPVGQVVNFAAGERIVSDVFSPIYGWLDVTNKGGVYTGGGGSKGTLAGLPFGGSYLGYVATLAPTIQPIEMGTHGMFGEGSVNLLPNGDYVLTNTRGEHYQF